MIDKKAIYEALGHLGAALAQSISTDDQVIVGHIRSAYQALGGDLSRYVGYPWTTLDKPEGRNVLVIRKTTGEVVVFPWTRVTLNVLLKDGDVVDRYEMWPLGPEHVGVGGVVLELDMGRRLVVEYSVSSEIVGLSAGIVRESIMKHWTRVDRITDCPPMAR